MSHVHRLSIAFLAAAALAAQTPVEVVRVTSKAVERHVKLPGEFRPYLGVPIIAKLSGFVEKIAVDRGSVVKEGDLLATLVAPEMKAQIVEAQSKAQAIGLQRAEAAAKLAGSQSTYQHLKAASATPGVVAENDVVVAEKTVEAAQALVHAYEDSIKAAQAQVRTLQELEQYLTIKAPFEGIITERDVHPGALVGPGSGSTPLLRLQQVSRLRLVVAVPEALVGGIVKGARVPFTVPAFPGETFYGALSRIAHSLDEKTRTMAVELDVSNPGLRLGPGMYPEVTWPVKRSRPSLLLPPTSIVTTTERIFVIRVKDGAVEWVSVSRGAPAGDLVEVFGPLKEGDVIVRRGSDELREGTKVKTQAPS
ncbi:MAG: efflux RND transporter periplasmic adaptor subunit [Candidatus Solibacter usitatus]|nr:efflux RND transporter periplasmic adaptor subunit [Candidatus Solibacter usitatus]